MVPSGVLLIAVAPGETLDFWAFSGPSDWGTVIF
jgi:hypothetical protein